MFSITLITISYSKYINIQCLTATSTVPLTVTNASFNEVFGNQYAILYSNCGITIRLQLWSDFFMMCVKFITQPSLQLEKFSERKETRIREKHQDMRVEMARQLQLMWATLDEFGESTF